MREFLKLVVAGTLKSPDLHFLLGNSRLKQARYIVNLILSMLRPRLLTPAQESILLYARYIDIMSYEK